MAADADFIDEQGFILETGEYCARVIAAAQNVVEWRHHNGPEMYEALMMAISHLEKLVGRSE